MLHYDESEYDDRDLDTPIDDHTDEDDHPYLHEDDDDEDEEEDKPEEMEDIKYEEELVNMAPEDRPEGFPELDRD